MIVIASFEYRDLSIAHTCALLERLLTVRRFNTVVEVCRTSAADQASQSATSLSGSSAAMKYIDPSRE
jgi:hypothetical protein